MVLLLGGACRKGPDAEARDAARPPARTPASPSAARDASVLRVLPDARPLPGGSAAPAPRPPPPAVYYEADGPCPEDRRVHGATGVTRVQLGPGRTGRVRTPLGCGVLAEPESAQPPDGYRLAAAVVTRTRCSPNPPDPCGLVEADFSIHGPLGRPLQEQHTVLGPLELWTVAGRYVVWSYRVDGILGARKGQIVDATSARRFELTYHQGPPKAHGMLVLYHLSTVLFGGDNDTSPEKRRFVANALRCFDLRTFTEHVLPKPKVSVGETRWQGLEIDLLRPGRFRLRYVEEAGGRPWAERQVTCPP